MSELKNFPFKNQLNEPNIDHLPDQNARMNCLPTCLAAGMQYLTGKEYTGSEVEHAVYGPAYRGGTSAIEYVHFLSSAGVRFYAVSGSPAYLVQTVHEHLSQGHPVVGTIPSTYLPPKDRMNPGESHCIVFYKDSAGVLIAMNPWQAISQANTDQWWADRFCFGQVWILERGTMSGIPQGWKDDGKELVAPNGKKVVLGFRSWVMAHDWRLDDYPLEDEQHQGSESYQVFNSTMLSWDSQRGVRITPLGPFFLVAEKERDDAKNAAAQALAAQKALQAEIDALKAQPAQPKTDNGPLVKSLTTVADSIQNIIDSL